MRTRIRNLFATIGALVACAAGAAAQENAPQPMPMLAVERILLAPPATGLVVVAVLPDGPAHALGLVPGDLLVRYGDTGLADLDALRGAMAEAADGGPVGIAVLSAGGEERTVTVEPGRLGVDLRAVRAGEGVAPLPEDTAPVLAFGALGDDLDEWHRFEFGGAHAGFEHARLDRTDRRLSVRREVAFDGGEQWGINHFDVAVALDTAGRLRPLRTSFTNVTNGWRGIGERAGDDAWRVTWQHTSGDRETFLWRLPDDLPIVPTYLAEYVARALPREVGACLRYRPLNEGMGRTGLMSAFIVAARETIAIDGREVETWRVEQRELGAPGPVRTWIDARGRAVRIDYRGGAVGVLVASRAEALEGLPEAVRPNGD